MRNVETPGILRRTIGKKKCFSLKRQERKRQSETAGKADFMRHGFVLLYVILCLLKDLLIFDMCLALFYASPSLASPSL